MNTSFRDAYAWTGDVLAALRTSLDEHHFAEILPVILSKRYEPGARHSIAVLGDRARPNIVSNQNGDSKKGVTVSGADYYYLPVSHCVEKQLALEHAERVYCVAPCVRLLMEGEENTGRHLYTFFQVEVEWHTESAYEVYSVTESILARFAEELLGRLADGNRLDDETRTRIHQFAEIPYKKLSFAQARAQVATAGGAINPHAAGDFTHAQEMVLSESATHPFWLTDYPDGVRDSLYRRTPTGTFATYDLMLPQGHGELATGGLRPDSAEDIIKQASKLGTSFHRHYAEWKARTKLQTGGLGFGLERLVRYCAGAESVLDLRVAHDQGPNEGIEKVMHAWT